MSVDDLSQARPGRPFHAPRNVLELTREDRSRTEEPREQRGYAP